MFVCPMRVDWALGSLLAVWNVACALKKFWGLLSKTGYTGVAWTYCCLFKEETIWMVQARGESTITRSKLLSHELPKDEPLGKS